MKLRTIHIVESKIFGEVRQPKRIIELDEIDSYLVYHTYSLSRPGANLWSTKMMLTLYSKVNLEMRNHIEIEFPINDFSYSNKDNCIILATGQYDGGYMFEGQLLKWNLENNTLTKILEDNREYRKVEILEDCMIVDVMPEDDGVIDQSIKQYSIQSESENGKLGNYNYRIVNKTKEDNHRLDAIKNIELARKKLEEIGRNYDGNYRHRYSANCMHITKGNEIIVGFNDSKASVIKISDLLEKEIKINPIANCYQIVSLKGDKVVLNFFSIWPPENYAYVISNDGCFEKEVKLKGLIYTNSRGDYFTKQIEPYPYNQNILDLHLDENLNPVKSIRIGNYNGYQHHLNASTENAFYFFQGIDDYKYTKNLVEYSIKNRNLRVVYEFKEDEKFVNTNGVMINENLILACSVPFRGKENKLLKINIENKNLSKVCELKFQLIQLTTYCDNHLMFLDVTGKLGIVELTIGTITYLNDQLKSKNQTPISFDLLEDKLAIGYDTGTVEILKIE